MVNYISIGMGRCYSDLLQAAPSGARVRFLVSCKPFPVRIGPPLLWVGLPTEKLWAAFISRAAVLDLYTDYPQSPSTIAGGEPSGAAWDEEEVEGL